MSRKPIPGYVIYNDGIEGKSSILGLFCQESQVRKLETEYAALQAKYESLKCCENCHWGVSTTNHTLCTKRIKNSHLVTNCDKWEMKDGEL